jgi:hypothetical protein
MKRLLVLALSLLAATSAFAQIEAPAPKPKSSRRAATSATSVARELNQMKESIAAQQRQIEQLQQQVQSRDQEIQQLQQQVGQAQSAAQQAQQAAAAASTQVPETAQQLGALQHDVTDLKAVSGKTANELQETKKGIAGLSDLAHGKVKIGGTFFADWSGYTDTGFGPQWFPTVNQPGPGNSGFNSFDVARAYINIFYTPNDFVTLRFTPNIYRQVDVSAAQAFGKGAAISSSSNGNLAFRLKYAYIDFNKLFANSEAFKNDKLTFGQTQNPLIDWEEGLSGYRYVYLVPWNYLSLSSTYTGVKLHGPITLAGKEYLDYDLGVFNTASFHAIESNDKKQVMGRLTWYPLGTTVDRTNLGFTVFENYGYNTKTPDTKSTPLNRLALLAHYQSHSKSYQIVGEYDLGRNAFSTGNLFSGSGPADEFGLGPSPYATFDALAKALLAGDRTRQEGFGFFGNVRLGDSPFRLFGLYHRFQPNTHIRGANPLDFARTVGGISYQVNKHFDFAISDSNLHYTHDQFTMSAAQIATFSSSLAASNPDGIPKVVPGDTNAIMINMQFNY